ncbi:uncharacterized protein LOC125748830 isoform X2 [Brienomyrus brachyistius]|uniref:uncharacterized protein LOC125748830 isoform X2 n=1 Tax=Brienomyrus brachyistius TaxID=42636 RepID=UPI0020B3C049|nr:uncharacterized protein LOC125748830 isoform X2 [Brienomyrus brachyistius]
MRFLFVQRGLAIYRRTELGKTPAFFPGRPHPKIHSCGKNTRTFSYYAAQFALIMTPLQDNGHVYAAPFLLLPGLLLLCTCCTYRKSNASCAKQKFTDDTEQVSQAATGSPVDGKRTDAVEAGHQPERKDAPNTHTEEEPARTAPLANRRLPSLPKSTTGRMAGSVVYDTVVDIREWPAAEAKVGRRQTSSCSSLYAEVRWGEKKSEDTSIFISAKPLSTRPSTCRDLASPSGDADFPLYAKVNKTGKRMVKSELIS